MPKSSLQDIVGVDGLVQVARNLDYKIVFDTLGTKTESYGRITQIGMGPNGQQSGYLDQRWADDYNTSELNGLDLKVDGNWVIDKSLKLVNVRLSLVGGAPYKDKDDKACIGADPSNDNINAKEMNGFIFPNVVNDDFVKYIKGVRDDASLMGGISLNGKVGQEWFAKFFDGFSEDGTEYLKLVKANALNAEVIFEKNSTTSTRFVFKVIKSDSMSDTDQYRASLTAINCGDPNLRNVGFNLCTESGVEIYGNQNKYFGSYSYNTKTGKLGNLGIDSLSSNFKDANVERYKFKQPSAFIRLFVLEENRAAAEKAIGKTLPEDLLKTNGTKLVQQVITDIGESHAYSNLKLDELRVKYAGKKITPSGKPAQMTLAQFKSQNKKAVYTLNMDDLVWVSIPYPCNVQHVYKGNVSGGMRIISSYTGIKEFIHPSGYNASSERLRNREFTDEEIARFCQEYRSNGGCKILMNKYCAASAQAFFNDLGNFFGDDIILALPSMCAITCCYAKREGAKGVHPWAYGIDFDYGHEPVSPNPKIITNDNRNCNRTKHEGVQRGWPSILWTEYKIDNGFMKPVVELIHHYKMRWGGLQPWHGVGGYDLMHFDWMYSS